ncbi:MAG: type III-A CRISPR-associated RAMP protein Csm5 [Candidatus Riflebacteria bacterium]|nr:type III-A CRISPR-associated RAMP protein Csm5 [Candidatus Riflebacteria bacterium]
MIKNYKVKLHVLSPIHIGMGDAYDPTQFVIDKDGLMYVFDTNDFLKSLDSEKSMEFCKLADNANNPVPVFRFFRDNFDIVKDKIRYRQVEIPSDLCSRYNEICDSESFPQKQINQFELRRNIYNPFKNVPYIPGSTIKGALKTIWLSSKNQKTTKITNAFNKYSDVEPFARNDKLVDDIMKIDKSKLGKGEVKFSYDPFRFVKVSDFYANSEVSSSIVYSINVPKNTNKKEKESLSVPLEAILAGNIFYGVITIDDSENIPKHKRPMTTVTLEDIAKKYCRAYYIPIMKNEQDSLKLLGGSMQYLNKIAEFGDKRFVTAFPIRIGMHSGAESVTIDGNRRIKIMQGKGRPPKYMDSPTTVWLASSTKTRLSNKRYPPFGWAMLEFEEMK